MILKNKTFSINESCTYIFKISENSKLKKYLIKINNIQITSKKYQIFLN